MSYLMNSSEILQTIQMIGQQHLDVRTVTMGVSLLDCADEDMDVCCRRIYDKICRCAGKLVQTGCDIENEFGIPIVNKRISVTPVSLVAAACRAEDYAPVARTLDRAAKEVGVNFARGHQHGRGGADGPHHPRDRRPRPDGLREAGGLRQRR